MWLLTIRCGYRNKYSLQAHHFWWANSAALRTHRSDSPAGISLLFAKCIETIRLWDEYIHSSICFFFVIALLTLIVDANQLDHIANQRPNTFARNLSAGHIERVSTQSPFDQVPQQGTKAAKDESDFNKPIHVRIIDSWCRCNSMWMSTSAIWL